MTTPEFAPSRPTAARPDVDLDCEFLPGDLTPFGLVSIGLTAGPGRSLYAVNADMDVAEVLSQPFMREHVWPHLPLTPDGALISSHPDVLSYTEIRQRVEAFFAELGEDVTLWVYCGAQDVIRLHTLWGNDWSVMPETIPQWADDLARLRRLAGGVKLPPHTGRPHHALDDAEHQRRARAYLRSALRPTSVPEDECTCVINCVEDPKSGCSLSGQRHVHPAVPGHPGVYGPCPEHPDAPGDL
ncbi:3'-5' exoribonuclease [Streptomyces sp. ARC14]|uniref:hypothetical protein n=1 Tax=Streptomyces sp. ARC14 TaxID=2724152 RepID=UPI003857D790